MPSPLLRLQRAVGNRATAGLVRGGAAGRLMLQRDTDEHTATTKTQRVVAFLIRKKDDGYIQTMRDYLRTTRHGLEVYEVDNLDDIAAKAAELTAKGAKIDRVLIISHGQRGIGGLGMKDADGQWKFVPPDRIKQWATTGPAAKLQGAMASGSEVQVLGCYLGANHEAGEAIATAFGATARASRGQEMVRTFTFETENGHVGAAKDVPAKQQAKFRT